MSEVLVDSLNKRITDLEKKNTNLQVALREARKETSTAKLDRDGFLKERDDLQKSMGTLTTERDDAKKRLESAPSELQAEIDRLKGEIRTRDHRKVFDKVAKEAGVLDKAVDDLWTLSGYKAEGDAPDEKSIGELMKGAKDARPHLFAAPEAAGSTTADASASSQAEKPLTEGLSAGRGARDTASSRLTVRRQDVGDPNWMRANQNRMDEAQANGTLVYVD
jgi:hypothetical protein